MGARNLAATHDEIGLLCRARSPSILFVLVLLVDPNVDVDGSLVERKILAEWHDKLKHWDVGSWREQK